MPKRKMTLDAELAAEAKSIVALAFRNGPIEDIHAGKECPICAGKSEYSHITQTEMKNIMKGAVDTVYRLLSLKQNDPEKYNATIHLGSRYTQLWDEPKAEVG
jgi:high-affinity K+ transport system ATPase subunit B